MFNVTFVIYCNEIAIHLKIAEPCDIFLQKLSWRNVSAIGRNALVFCYEILIKINVIINRVIKMVKNRNSNELYCYQSKFFTRNIGKALCSSL